MKAQFIKTEGGEELVVLTRREYDALLARSGDEAAELRATVRMTQDYFAVKASGDGANIPLWFVKLVTLQGSSIKAARKHAGCTQAELAHILDISQGHLSDLENGRRKLSEEQARKIAGHTGIEAGWLL